VDFETFARAGLGERLTFLDDTTNDFPTGRAG